MFRNKNKWEREYPEKAVRAYYGSAGGNRKANVKLMETIKKSSKSVEIEILWYGKTEDAAEREQYHTTKHNWPTHFFAQKIRKHERNIREEYLEQLGYCKPFWPWQKEGGEAWASFLPNAKKMALFFTGCKKWI